jgi:phosphatidylserine decarboxylase
MKFFDNLKNFLDIPQHVWKHLFFFRDPDRTVVPNKDILISPADGTILYAAKMPCSEKVLTVKGIPKISINDIVKKDLPGEAYIVGIFMSFWDVHINRIPSDGYLTYERVLSDKLLSMIDVENRLIKNQKPILWDSEYLIENERLVSTVTTQKDNKEWIYYIVQIADAEVEKIVPFHDSGTTLTQGTRMGMIRWGSQVDVIIPCNQGIDVEILVKEQEHIKAGLDPIIKII